MQRKSAEGREPKLRKKFKWLISNKVQCCISQVPEQEQVKDTYWLLIIYENRHIKKQIRKEFRFDNNKESLCSYIGGISKYGPNSLTPDVYNKETIMRFLHKRGFSFE